MNQQIKDELVAKATAQLGQLLTEHADEIIDAFAAAVFDNDAKKYRVEMSVEMAPFGGDFWVKAGIGVKTVDETDPAFVSGTMPLPGMSEGGE